MREIPQALIAIAMGLLVSHPVQGSDREPTDQPRVISYGRFEGGGMALCMSAQCAQALAGAERTVYKPERTLEPEVGVDRELFCELLEDQQPENCEASDPPSTPGLDSSWDPNGCGTDPHNNLFLHSGLAKFFTDSYSGNFHAPYPGISFRLACNNHDACWGVAGNRATCDNSFHDSMRSACDGVAEATSRTVCNGFAAAYFSAVAATDIGNGNYQESVENRKCALWAHDMKINGCE